MVCLALIAFASPLSNSKVFWYPDNQNVKSILRNVSRKCNLHDLALVAFRGQTDPSVRTVTVSSLTSMVTASNDLFFKS